MFRSERRPVVYPQAEHARLAGTIAAAWGNDDFEPPPLPFDSFVRGVALHDRGYGELDADGIGEVARERWVEIQQRGFEPRGVDPVVDLIVALHIRRLVGTPRHPAEAAALPAMKAALPRLAAAAGVEEADAQAADRITDLCDRISFDFCCEEPDSGSVEIVPRRGAAPVAVAYAVDVDGVATLDPWPLGVASLTAVVAGFEADGYPERLEPVASIFRLRR